MSDTTGQLYLDFDTYEQEAEPNMHEKASAWRTAIGLQEVDGLEVSGILKKLAARHIEGEVSIDEVRERLRICYAFKTSRDKDDRDMEEADRVAANIVKLLSQGSFSLTPLELINIHRHLFEGVMKHAGEIRKYDVSRKEWVLDGDSVAYGRAADIPEVLIHDIQQERDFSYSGLSSDGIVAHIADFVSLLWQNHPFREGNTRTMAVFVIKYLRWCGFDVNNDLFAENSRYFHNALVRANYRNISRHIQPDKSFLVLFFRNLILGERNEMKNGYLHIGNIDSRIDGSTSTPTGMMDDDSNPSANVMNLIRAIGCNELSVRELMETLGLRDRKNFLQYTLAPAMRAGLVRARFPESPRHPRQKYLLTVKGLMLEEGNA